MSPCDHRAGGRICSRTSSGAPVSVPMWRSRSLRVALAASLAVVPHVAGQVPVVNGDLGRRLDSAVTAAERSGFSGAVLVVQRGTVLLERGAGLAIESPPTPFTRATVIPIGSNTKDFTKTAILQLVEEGRLSLEDSLGRFFPDAPADKRAITLRQLLDHAAGFPIGVGSDDEVIGLDAWRRRLFAAPLEFAPGASRRYSNPGYSLLAAIIEQVAGTSYERYLAAHVFAPAGMQETGLALPHFDAGRLAHAYTAGRDRGTMLDLPRDPDGAYWNLRGNGGLVSTLDDMRSFYRTILDDTMLLKDAGHRRMVVRADGPSVLAGSDLVSFFLYGLFPGAGIEFVLASNHAAAPAPRLLDALLPIVGIRPPPGGSRRDDGPAIDGGPARTRVPDSGPGRTVAAYLEAYNSGDTAAMRSFFTERAVAGPETPSLEARLDRYRQMRENLGRLTVENVTETSDGIEVRARSANGDLVTLAFAIEPAAPYRMRGMRVQVG
jgi:CubicO group peptidase (beta-lactamase class C family)